MLITVIGNCQADCIARAIRVAAASDAAIEVRYIMAYRDTDVEGRAALRDSDILVEQLTDRPQKASPSLEDCSARRIRFPLLEAGFLYPFSTTAHPRAVESRRTYIPDGFYEAQMSDSRLIRLMTDHPGETAEEIADRYVALDYAELLDLDELLDLSREKAQRLGTRAGFDMWPRIERLFRYQPVFWTRLHPTEALLRPLCRHVLEQLGLGLTDAEIEAAAGSGTGLGFAHMPIHPSLARHYGIEWATPAKRYRFLQEGLFTVSEFATRFARFTHDDAMMTSLAALHGGGDLHAAVSGLLDARGRHPESAEVLINLAAGFCRFGDVPNALEASIAALELEPDRADCVRLACSLVRLLVPKRELRIDDTLAAAQGVTQAAA